MSKYTIACYILLLLHSQLTIGETLERNKSKSKELLLESNIKVNESSFFLDISIINNYKYPITTYYSFLPWGIYSAIDIHIIPFTYEKKLLFQNNLSPITLIDDPGYKVIQLQPNEKVSGTIELNSRFSELSKHKNYLLCWDYTFFERSGNEFNYTGYNIFSQNKLSVDKNIFHNMCLTQWSK